MKNYFKYIFGSVIFILIFSCTKIRENKIEGTWEYVPVASWEESIDEKWTFNENDEIVIEKIYNTISSTVTDTGVYYVKSEGLSGYVEVYDLDNYTNGKYRIKKLTNNQLKILRLFDGAGNSEYVLKEFIRSSK